eukprot:ANDGO_08009.mRNA.1 Checkpoint protein hus1 homolog
MKFRGRLNSPSSFLKIVQVLEKSSKFAFLKLAQDTTQIIIRSDILDSSQVWFEGATSKIFHNLKLASATDSIVLEVDLSSLSKALRSSSVSHASAAEIECELRLVKKGNTACLSVILIPQTLAAVKVNHDIPIRVLGHAEAASLVEPVLPHPAVQITLPALRDLKAIVDRLKSNATQFSLSASFHGEFSISVQTDTMTLGTVFRNLENISSTGRPSQSQTSRGAEPISVWVDAKKLARPLFAHNLQPSRCVASFIPDRVIVIHALLADEELFLSFFVPVHSA